MKALGIAIAVLAGVLGVAAANYAALDYAAHITPGGIMALIATDLGIAAFALFMYLDVRD